MDAARQGYYHVVRRLARAAWLLDGFTRAMGARGIGPDVRRRLFVDNPARAFAFAVDRDGRRR